jgi:hypothetical protein
MWLTGCPAPDFKTIAGLRKDNGAAIRKVCREFIAVCGRAGVLTATAAAIDGSKFRAVNSRGRNFTEAKVAKRQEQIEASPGGICLSLKSPAGSPRPQASNARTSKIKPAGSNKNRAHESHRGAT